MNPEASSHSHQVGERAGAHFAHYTCAMRLHGPFGCSQLGADLFVQQTGGYQAENFAFAGGQRALEVFKFDPLQLFSAPSARKIGAACDRAQQSLIVNRLFEEIHGAFPHRLHSERQIAVTGDENDRCVWNRAVEFLLKLKPVHSWQVNVSHDTIKFLRINGLEKFLSRGISGDLKAGGTELEEKGLPHPLVIFDYRDPDGSGRLNSFDVVAVFRAAALRSNASLCGCHPFSRAFAAKSAEILQIIDGREQLDSGYLRNKQPSDIK
ncbi:MAG: hypothetical protein WA993_14120 [Candidatus Binatus sp.]